MLRWWLTKLDHRLENADLVDVMNDLGISTSKDTTSNNLYVKYYSQLETHLTQKK